MLKKDQIFPSKSEVARIELQTKWEKMFHSEYIYTRVYDPVKKISMDVDPLVPLPSVISEISSDLLFGEFPILSYTDEKADKKLDEWLETNTQFNTDLLEASAYTSALGTIFLIKFRMEEQVFYEFVTGNKCVWEEDVLGLTRFTMFKIEEVNEKQKYRI